MSGPVRPEGAAADIGIRWRVEGTEGHGAGTIGWPEFPQPTPSTLDYTTSTRAPGFAPLAGSLVSRRVCRPDGRAALPLEAGSEPAISGRDNLGTMALVDACLPLGPRAPGGGAGGVGNLTAAPFPISGAPSRQRPGGGYSRGMCRVSRDAPRKSLAALCIALPARRAPDHIRPCGTLPFGFTEQP